MGSGSHTPPDVLFWEYPRATNSYLLLIVIQDYESAFDPVTLKYSCFEKGCLTNDENLSQQCRKLLWVMVVLRLNY